ncbi:t-SNARE [Flagelloscypha sp. PMI_526]|nr:t-SNARE [Flagelloscypha sp. PMI_526]
MVFPVQDRTNEFQACVDSIRNRSHVSARQESKQRLLNGSAGRHSKPKSEFSQMASAIGKNISSTNLKLNKLGQLAKRKTLFDDRPVEISELTFIIKQDIATLNKEIAKLQAYIKQKALTSSKSPEANQIAEHSSNVVMLLQSNLANASITFKDVLELRTQNMKESKDRTEQFMSSTALAANSGPSSMLYNPQRHDPMGDGSPSRLDQKGKSRSRTPVNGDVLALNLDAAEEGASAMNGQYQQMQMVEQQDTYLDSRRTAIESIESTIVELGQIFNQLATMVAEQRETVQRIDADTIDIASNVGGAQRELLRYYASISSNRWLILKIFGVLIAFFLVFILVS